MKAVAGILTLFVVMPIWFYLLYQILVRVDASELMWFLYWAYVPIMLLAHTILKLAEKDL